MPHQGPKEHQNQGFGSNFWHLEVTRNAWYVARKIDFFSFFLIFSIQCTHKPLEAILPIKIPHWEHKEYHFRLMGSGFRSEIGHIQPWKLTEKWIFWLFSQFFLIFSIQWPQKPVETNLPIKIPHWGHKEYHSWPMGSGFRSGNGHIQTWNSLATFMVGYGRFQT